VRAVLDVNVIISALLSPQGSPANIVREWLDGAFDLVASALLFDELECALGYPKLRTRVTVSEATELIELMQREAILFHDPDEPPGVHSPDPGDDYLVALAAASESVLVSGGGHLLGLAEHLPVYSPAEFLALIRK